jgi:hypothetical protein
MSAFSPLDAAYEGIRVVRREPKAVAYWVAVWAVALALIAAVRLFTGALSASHGPGDDLSVIRRYGPLAVVLAPTLLVLWIMTTATVYRAVLRQGEHGWHLFKLGPDEARIAVLSAAESVLLGFLGGVPAYLLLVLLNPIFEMAPALNRITAVGGFMATMAIDIWLAVRLSLAPAQTFAERGFPLAAYWGLGRHRFWRMLAAYALVALEVLLFLFTSVIVGLIFGWLAEVVVHWNDPTLLRRAVLWLLVAVLAVLTAVVWVVPLILIGACQAFIYRAIAAEHAAATGTAAVASPNPTPA